MRASEPFHDYLLIADDAGTGDFDLMIINKHREAAGQYHATHLGDFPWFPSYLEAFTFARSFIKEKDLSVFLKTLE